MDPDRYTTYGEEMVIVIENVYESGSTKIIYQYFQILEKFLGRRKRERPEGLSLYPFVKTPFSEVLLSKVSSLKRWDLSMLLPALRGDQ